MRIVRVTICLLVAGLVTACGKEAPPISVAEFMENPRLLEATMVRCGQNRAEMKYESECVNARDAVNRLERAEERERRELLEAQSERKRQALRATQEAAAAARRRAEEERRRREEAEYLGIFDEPPADAVTPAPAATPGQAPNMPVAAPETAPQPAPAAEVPLESPEDEQPESQEEVSASDLAAIREELRRRQQNPQ